MVEPFYYKGRVAGELARPLERMHRASFLQQWCGLIDKTIKSMSRHSAQRRCTTSDLNESAAAGSSPAAEMG